MRSKIVKFLSIPFLFLVIIFGLNFFSPNLFGPISHTIGSPFFAFKKILGERTRNVSSYFFFKKSLVIENKELKEKLNELEGVLLGTNLLIKENEELKLELGRNASSKKILAYVLSGPGSSPYDTFLLDVGTKEGILEGDKIFISGGVPLGYIKEVEEHTSLGRLYSSPGEELQVLVPPNNFLEKAHGRGGGSFEMAVPKEIDIKKGDVITFPGIEGGIVGIVGSIEVKAEQSLKTVFFGSIFNVYQIEKVYIEK